MKVDELPDGFYKTSEGVLLTPEEFDKLQALMPDEFWIIIVDPDLQKLRNKKPDIDFDDAK